MNKDNFTEVLLNRGSELFHNFSTVKKLLKFIEEKHGDIKISEIPNSTIIQHIADGLSNLYAGAGTLEREFTETNQKRVLDQVQKEINEKLFGIL